MAADGFSGAVSVAGQRRLGRALSVLILVASLAACRLIGTQAGSHASSDERAVATAAGWTRIATTEKYLVVANVLPGEEMFSAAEAHEAHPTEGELIIEGTGRALDTNVRHVEAHIYDRRTGMPLTNVQPTIVVFNRTTGERIEVPSTLMQDVNIGALDIHYGNNVVLQGNSDLSLSITIGDEVVTLDGHLD